MSEEHPAPEGTFARPLGPLAAAGWSSAFLVAFVILGSIFASIKPGAERDGVTAAMLYTASVLGVLLILVRVHAPDMELRDVVAARPLGFLSALLASMMGAAASFPLSALESVITKRFFDPERAAQYTKDLQSVAPTTRIVGVLTLVIVAPIADELFFRGAITTGVVRDRGRLSAAIASAFTFALISSADDLHFLPLFVIMGLVFVHARLATGSVLAAIGAHLGYRAAELARELRVHRTIDPLVTGIAPTTMPWKIHVAGGILAVLFAYLLSRIGEGERVLPKAALEPKTPASGTDES